ncbi:MAG: hypothetical protein ACOH2M_06775 [Cypionkella sp.]
MRWRRLIWAVPAGVSVAIAAGIALQPATPFTPQEMAARVAALWRYGAIEVPQQLAAAGDPAQGLMARVAAGEAFDAVDSASYRRAIQAVLADHQRLFALLDNNLCLVQDAGPAQANNVGGQGIAGLHDLHAASALSNFDEMQADLVALADAGALRRIYLANEAYKDLTDLMVHLAPATQSVVLVQAPALPLGADPDLATGFAAFREAMARASFAGINSPAYLAAVAEAEAAYTALALRVQAMITERLSPLEQKIAGRWLAVQGVQPRLNLDKAG